MKLSKAERTRRVEDAIHLMGLSASASLDVSKLDNGTRQKVAVAREVARQPQIILFDEPITNVDALETAAQAVAQGTDRSLSQTIVYVTHDQTEAMTLADQIALMEEGKIVQCAPPRELYNHPDDRFGGWFLGNPGMVFFAASLSGGPHKMLESPLFPSPVSVSIDGAANAGTDVTVGIRPEHIRVVLEPKAGTVPANLVRKTVQIGGQYLVALRVEGLEAQSFKAKVAPTAGERLPDSGPVYVELPLTHVTLFDAGGIRIPAQLQPVNESMA